MNSQAFDKVFNKFSSSFNQHEHSSRESLSETKVLFEREVALAIFSLNRLQLMSKDMHKGNLIRIPTLVSTKLHCEFETKAQSVNNVY